MTKRILHTDLLALIFLKIPSEVVRFSILSINGRRTIISNPRLLWHWLDKTSHDPGYYRRSGQLGRNVSNIYNDNFYQYYIGLLQSNRQITEPNEYHLCMAYIILGKLPLITSISNNDAVLEAIYACDGKISQYTLETCLNIVLSRPIRNVNANISPRIAEYIFRYSNVIVLSSSVYMIPELATFANRASISVRNIVPELPTETLDAVFHVDKQLFAQILNRSNRFMEQIANVDISSLRKWQVLAYILRLKSTRMVLDINIYVEATDKPIFGADVHELIFEWKSYLVWKNENNTETKTTMNAEYYHDEKQALMLTYAEKHNLYLLTRSIEKCIWDD